MVVIEDGEAVKDAVFQYVDVMTDNLIKLSDEVAAEYELVSCLELGTWAGYPPMKLVKKA